MKNKFAFFGTDSIALPVLDELKNAGFIPDLIICSPDKPKGRGMQITQPAAKVWAINNSVPVFQPEKLDDEAYKYLATFSFEYGVVASYGKIIPKNILDIFPKGLLNVHPSLLPKLRGASPIESTILNEDVAGVTIIKLDEKMDHGPIVTQEKVDIDKWPPKYSSLEKDLGKAGGRLLASVLTDYLENKIVSIDQDENKATFTKKFTKEDGLIDFNESPQKILRKIRAFEEWPRAYFMFNKKDGSQIKIVITNAEVVNDEIHFIKIIPEGKKEMLWDDFLRGVQN